MNGYDEKYVFRTPVIYRLCPWCNQESCFCTKGLTAGQMVKAAVEAEAILAGTQPEYSLKVNLLVGLLVILPILAGVAIAFMGGR